MQIDLNYTLSRTGQRISPDLLQPDFLLVETDHIDRPDFLPTGGHQTFDKTSHGALWRYVCAEHLHFGACYG